MIKFSKDLCIFIPCSYKEYKNNRLSYFLKNFFKKKPSSKYSFDFYFFFDQIEDSKSLTQSIKSLLNYDYVNNFYIHSFNLHPENNFFDLTLNLNDPIDFIPDSGTTSGPNKLFFKSIFYLQNLNLKYKNFLLLETDVFIMRDLWFDKILEFVINNNFLIAGSTYKGLNVFHNTSNYKDHLNGVAIYKNNKKLYKLVENTELYIYKEISNKNSYGICYDTAINYWLESEDGLKFKKKSQPLIEVDFITNCSDIKDQNFTKDHIMEQYPQTLILHKKPDYEEVSQF